MVKCAYTGLPCFWVTGKILFPVHWTMRCRGNSQFDCCTRCITLPFFIFCQHQWVLNLMAKRTSHKKGLSEKIKFSYLHIFIIYWSLDLIRFCYLTVQQFTNVDNQLLCLYIIVIMFRRSYIITIEPFVIKWRHFSDYLRLKILYSV